MAQYLSTDTATKENIDAAAAVNIADSIIMHIRKYVISPSSWNIILYLVIITLSNRLINLTIINLPNENNDSNKSANDNDKM